MWKSMDTREEKLRTLVTEFPHSPMSHFSLGKYLLDARRYADAATALRGAVTVDRNYAAAWLCLGDALLGGGDEAAAVEAWKTAAATPHGRKDASLQADVERRLAEVGIE